MLHVRDCPGRLSNGDVCPFPWCRKVKHLLYHLVSCDSGSNNDSGSITCPICLPTERKLSPNLAALAGLNTYRRNKFKERVKAILAKRRQLNPEIEVRANSKAQPSEGFVLSQSRKFQANSNSSLQTAALNPRVLAAKLPSECISANEAPAAVAVQQQIQHPQLVQGQEQLGRPSAVCTASSMSASAAVATSLTNSAKSATKTTLQTPSYPHKLPLSSPSSILKGCDPSLSTNTLPLLEEAVLEIGDITLSAADLLGPTPTPSGHIAANASATNTSHATHRYHTSTTIVVNTKATAANANI